MLRNAPQSIGGSDCLTPRRFIGLNAAGQKEFIVYAPTTEINILPVDNSDQLVTSGSTTSSGDDPYGILEKGN